MGKFLFKFLSKLKASPFYKIDVKLMFTKDMYHLLIRQERRIFQRKRLFFLFNALG